MTDALARVVSNNNTATNPNPTELETTMYAPVISEATPNADVVNADTSTNSAQLFLAFGATNPFAMDSNENVRKGTAARVAKHRAVSQIVQSIKSSGTNVEQQTLALHHALLHNEVAEVANRIGLLRKMRDEKAHRELAFCFEQLQKICKVATKTNKANGRTNDSKSLFVENIFTGIVATDLEAHDPR